MNKSLYRNSLNRLRNGFISVAALASPLAPSIVLAGTCTNNGGGIWACTGAASSNNTDQPISIIETSPVDVSGDSTFGLSTVPPVFGTGVGINIQGNGGLIFSMEPGSGNISTIDRVALRTLNTDSGNTFIQIHGDIGVPSQYALSAIDARNEGAGDLSIRVYGNLFSGQLPLGETIAYGIRAASGGDADVYTAGDVFGAFQGITVTTSGELNIRADGSVSSIGGVAIFAASNSGNIHITAKENVTSSEIMGIETNALSGDTYIDIAGVVAGADAYDNSILMIGDGTMTLKLRDGWGLVGQALIYGNTPLGLRTDGNVILGGEEDSNFDLANIVGVSEFGNPAAANSLVGFSHFAKEDSSNWVITGAQNIDFESAEIREGSLTFNDQIFRMAADASAFDVQSAGTLFINGTSSQLMGDLNLGGVLSMQNGTTGDVFTIAGNYTGNGGLFALDTALGDDVSPTDRLVVEGDTVGPTSVKVTNAGGTGAQTVEGIKIIEVGGASDGTFTLLGDYETQDNKQAIRGGAYAYTLEHHGISTPNDGNWYLRSTFQTPPVEPEQPVEPGEPQPGEPAEPGQPGTPRYDAGTPVYEAYPQALLALNGVSTLQQRVGNRVWAGNGNKVIAEGADAIGTPYAAPEEAGTHIEGNGVWGRIEGAHNHIETGRSTTGVDYDQNIFKLQAGVDGMLMENENGKLIGGISVHYAHGLTKTASIYDAKTGGGRIGTDGYGLGGTLTWYGENGVYVDAQAQATWYDSDLSYAGGNQSLIDGNDGFGYALSIEGGKRIALDPSWSLTPQAQLVYSSVDFDDFHDVDNIAVRLDKGDSLQGRVGLTLDHQTAWQNANGMLDRAHVYGIANLYYEFLEGTRVNVADVSFANRKDRLWGGIGLGGSYNWNDDKYSIYGEGLVNTSLNNFADSYSLKGNVGFRVKW